MRCPNCNAELSGNRCEYCGSVFSTASAEANVPADHDYTYPEVLTDQYRTEADSFNSYSDHEEYFDENTSHKSKIAALLLCFFFGFYGVHYFYVGRFGMGILYFLTYGFCGVGWIVDIVRILLGQFKDANEFALR